MIYANHKACPICRKNTADSKHHIKPRSRGGTDSKRNEVWLCKRCHDIVEEIYDRTGLEYSSALVKLIRLDYGFDLESDPINPTPHNNVSQQPIIKRFRILSPKKPRAELAMITCARCGQRFQQTRSTQALCESCRKCKTTVREARAIYAEENRERTVRIELLRSMKRTIRAAEPQRVLV